MATVIRHREIKKTAFTRKLENKKNVFQEFVFSLLTCFLTIQPGFVISYQAKVHFHLGWDRLVAASGVFD
jgi:hypothetical protein